MVAAPAPETVITKRRVTTEPPTPGKASDSYRSMVRSLTYLVPVLVQTSRFLHRFWQCSCTIRYPGIYPCQSWQVAISVVHRKRVYSSQATRTLFSQHTAIQIGRATMNLSVNYRIQYHYQQATSFLAVKTSNGHNIKFCRRYISSATWTEKQFSCLPRLHWKIYRNNLGTRERN